MKKYGLIGNPLSHSFSKKYFTQKFEDKEIVDSIYDLYPLTKVEDLQLLIDNERDLVGLNVTIPFKEKVIPLLDELDPIAKEIGAVNTILINRNGADQPILKGYNTDAIGFRDSLKPFLAKNHSRALVFGSGGSSKAIAFVLKQLNIPFFIVSRDPEGEAEIAYSDLEPNSIKRFQILINCTPLGTTPNEESIIPIRLDEIGPNHLVYDLVYNPLETLLLTTAKKQGAIVVNGLSMLRLQANASWVIWNNA